MYAYELLPRLKYLTLTVDNDAEYWEERIEFIGTAKNFKKCEKEELILSGAI